MFIHGQQLAQPDAIGPSGGNSWWGVVKNARKVGLNKSGGFSNSTVLSDFFCDFELVELGLCSIQT